MEQEKWIGSIQQDRGRSSDTVVLGIYAKVPPPGIYTSLIFLAHFRMSKISKHVLMAEWCYSMT